jgi:hypothetical protein
MRTVEIQGPSRLHGKTVHYQVCGSDLDLTIECTNTKLRVIRDRSQIVAYSEDLRGWLARLLSWPGAVNFLLVSGEQNYGLRYGTGMGGAKLEAEGISSDIVTHSMMGTSSYRCAAFSMREAWNGPATVHVEGGFDMTLIIAICCWLLAREDMADVISG